MPKSKKRNTTSKKTSKAFAANPGGRGKKGTTIGGKEFIRQYPGQDPRFEEHPDFKPDPETTAPEPDDEASKHRYPPPKKDKIFREKWGQFIDSVSGRENFKVGHLNTLEILCDLYVEYDQLQKFIRRKGRTYKSVGRAGEVWKFYPEVMQLNKVQGQIKDYTKMLNLLPKKDHSGDDGGEGSEWN